MSGGFDSGREDTEVPSLLDRQLFKTWSPDPGKPPALLLNAVDVSTGQRLVLTPFHEIESRKWPVTYSDLWLNCKHPKRSYSAQRRLEARELLLRPDSCATAPSLGTAMFMSARFPVVTPPARIRVGDHCQAPHVIDGGAFDNSGVETARDVIDAIRKKEENKKDRFGLIVVGFETPEKPFPLKDGAPPIDELLGPVSAFINSWRIRTIRSKELAGKFYDARSEICQGDDPLGVVDVSSEAPIEIFRNRLG